MGNTPLFLCSNTKREHDLEHDSNMMDMILTFREFCVCTFYGYQTHIFATFLGPRSSPSLKALRTGTGGGLKGLST